MEEEEACSLARSSHSAATQCLAFKNCHCAPSLARSLGSSLRKLDCQLPAQLSSSLLAALEVNRIRVKPTEAAAVFHTRSQLDAGSIVARNSAAAVGCINYYIKLVALPR